MTGRFQIVGAACAAAVLLLTACGAQDLDTFLGTTLDQVDDIRNDVTLEPQDKRDALAALGIDEVTINGILRSEQFGNQFGGTLTTAFNKVVNGEMATMTPDEIQIYADETGAGTFSDDAGQKLTNFFADNGITTRESLGEALDDPTIEFISGLSEETVRAVFVDFDPDDLIEALP